MTGYCVQVMCELFMGIKLLRSDKLIVESDGSAFAKGLLGRNNKTFIGLPRT